MRIKSFKQLIVWQKSVSLAKQVYELTDKFPKSEQFGLISQMRRCSVAIPSNIAEGSRRRTKKDYIHFLHISSGSAAELETQLILAKNIYSRFDYSKAEELLIEI